MKQSALILAVLLVIMAVCPTPLVAQNFTWSQASAPSEYWLSIVSSSDGTRLAAVVQMGGIYTSTNSGATWTQTSAPTQNWWSIASSADGTKLVAVVAGGSGGGIYTSSNSGVTWTQTSAPTQIWLSVASSADGNNLAAVFSRSALYGQFYSAIYTSTNSGQSWIQTSAPNLNWQSIASSTDGTKLVAVAYGNGFGSIYRSTNSGQTWAQASAPSEYWFSIASSSDGTKLAAVAYGNGIYTSTDSGVTWTQTSAPNLNWPSIASSSDGTKLTAVASGVGIYMSTNSGLTWMQISALGNWWYSVASSSDGTKLVAVVNDGGIYTGFALPSITSQPSSQTIIAGSNATFVVVTFGGTLPLSYQWQFNGTNISNATNTSYALTGVTANNAGNYTVIVTNLGGSVTSSVAILTVVSITQQPQNQEQLLGKATVFNVVVSSPTLSTFQWYFNNPALQTTAKAKAALSGSFVYSTTVTNGGLGYTSLPRVQFIGGGGSGAGGTAAVSSGKVTSITMTNAGSGYTTAPAVLIDPPSGLLVGQTNATLNLSAITTNNFGNYFVVISNIYGSMTSSVATLTRAYPPGLTSQPQSQFIASGSGAFFSVTSTGTPPFSFQWWMVSSQLTNATATPLVTNGFVLGATITKGGAGYLAAPTVQFVGGSGSGAGGTAVVSNRMVTAINITNAGSGYATHPTIQIAAPKAVALSGQTASVFSLAAVTGTNAGNYYVVVTNYFGGVTSLVAVLTVELPGYNQITSQLLTNGNLRLSFVGLTGTNYALDRTFNLSPVNWMPQATNHPNAGGVLIFTNIPNKATNNFWRIRKVP